MCCKIPTTLFPCVLELFALHDKVCAHEVDESVLCGSATAFIHELESHGCKLGCGGDRLPVKCCWSTFQSIPETDESPIVSTLSSLLEELCHLHASQLVTNEHLAVLVGLQCDTLQAFGYLHNNIVSSLFPFCPGSIH